MSSSTTSSSSFVIQHAFRDVDELGMVARNWDLDFRQLNRGGFRGHLLHAGAPGLIVSHTRLGGVIHQFGSSPSGLRTFAFSTHASIDLRWRGHEVGRNQILAYPLGGEHESISQPDFDMMLVSLSEDSLETACHTLEVPGTKKFLKELEIESCDAVKLAQLRRWVVRRLAAVIRHPALLEDPEQMAQAGSEASNLIVEALTSGQSGAESHCRVRNRGLLDLAVRLAHGDAKRIHSVAELVRESGASRRTLQRGFQRRFGISPKAYLTAQRLIGVRRDLHSSNQQILVKDVANSWGFRHMGQFAADYHKMFGELPSETLQRRVGCPPSG